MAVALGLAGTQAAGLKSMFGTWESRSMPVGRGNGCCCTPCGARIHGQRERAEVAQGFIATQSDSDPSIDVPLPPRAACRGDLFKYHAACYLTIPASRRSSCCAAVVVCRP